MSGDWYDGFTKWEMDQETIKEFAELNEVIVDKRVYIVTCNISLEGKRLYTNMLVYVQNKFIISKVADFKLFIKELKNFHSNVDAKFVELKSKTTPNGVLKTLKIKDTDVYLTQAESETIVSFASDIERVCKYAVPEDIEKCEKYDYWNKLLIRCQITEDDECLL